MTAPGRQVREPILVQGITVAERETTTLPLIIHVPAQGHNLEQGRKPQAHVIAEHETNRSEMQQQQIRATQRQDRRVQEPKAQRRVRIQHVRSLWAMNRHVAEREVKVQHRVRLLREINRAMKHRAVAEEPKVHRRVLRQQGASHQVMRRRGRQHRGRLQANRHNLLRDTNRPRNVHKRLAAPKVHE
jgi:hypothetical protein